MKRSEWVFTLLIALGLAVVVIQLLAVTSCVREMQWWECWLMEQRGLIELLR